MTFTIDKPGIYFDVPVADYFADCCPMPSLTQSVAKILIDRSPAHARLAHPRLNPDFEPDDPKKYDIGNIAHTLLLGRGKRLVVIEGDDWVKDRKAKGEAREAAQAEGRLAVLSRDYDHGQHMVDAAGEALADRGLLDEWADGNAEVVAAAQVDGLWCRAMIDWMPDNSAVLWDLKTTSRSAAPWGIDWRVVEGGWDVQAAMHERILDAIDPQGAGRRVHRFLVQETEPPFAVTVVRLPEGVLTMGRKKLDAALRLWSDCLAHDRWPAYPLAEHIASYPGSAESRWLDREVADADARREAREMPDNVLAGG